MKSIANADAEPKSNIPDGLDEDTLREAVDIIEEYEESGEVPMSFNLAVELYKLFIQEWRPG
jgi:hypothetical protein